MAYDVELAERIRKIVFNEQGLTTSRMFGGLAFLINGHLAASASSQGGMLLRVDPAQTDSLVTSPHLERFQMRGREMNGWLRIAPEAISTERSLRKWIAYGLAYARSLPRAETVLVAAGFAGTNEFQRCRSRAMMRNGGDGKGGAGLRVPAAVLL